MPVIVFNGLNMHTLSVDKKTNIRLVPGRNDVAAEHLAILQDKKKGSAGFKHLLDNNEITILDDDAVDTNESGDQIVVLANMKGGDIKAIVEAEADLDVLKDYLAEETSGKNRAGTLKVIQAQIDSLVDAAKKAEENKTEE